MAKPLDPDFAHETWSSRRAFLLAAIGSAVGLGNVWRFPYITGVNGGGAFVIIYCACIVAIAIPLLMAEIAIGRRGGQSPIRSMQKLTAENGRSRFWHSLGWLSVITPTVGLMYYRRRCRVDARLRGQRDDRNIFRIRCPAIRRRFRCHDR